MSVRSWAASAAAAGLVALVLTSAAHSAEAPLPDAPDFSRDIRPILSNNCFKCHGPDDEKREADLRLDTFDGATRDLGGHQAIRPHDPGASTALQRIRATDPDLQMPPPASGLKLTDREIALLNNWIRQGAVYRQHWSFQPIQRPPVPDTGSTWPINPIDQFVLARLQAQQITPSPEADRTTLIRRVHLDLLGLPPTIDELDAFLNDTSPNAYATMVERALASPHYGERWGRHWLDQARYADTNGYTIDSERSLWPWRDWVIRALNSDMPFDQFTIEQLAGDLLPNPTQDQLVATGFHRNTLVNEEGGTDAEQFRNEAVVDRVNTTGAVWLGLTVGCAQCHTHKYDPLTHREYYQLFAFFNQGRDVNTTTPTLPVPSPAQAQQLAELEQQVAEAKARVAAYDQQVQAGQTAEQQAQASQPVQWSVVRVDKATSIAGALFTTLDDQSLLVSADNGATEKYTLRFRSPVATITAVRLETLTDPSLPAGGPGRAGNGNFVLTELTLQAPQLPATAASSAASTPQQTTSAKWIHATADHSQRDYAVTDAVDGQAETGWAINVERGSMNVNRTAVFVMQPLPTDQNADVVVELHFGPQPPAYNLGRFRVSVTDASHAQLQVPDPQRAALLADQKQKEDARKKLTAAIPTTLIMGDTDKPRTTHVLIRGDFLRKGDPVVPDVPAVFPGLAQLSEGEEQAAGTPPDSVQSVTAGRSRLDLARWLVDRRNPLTARVTVNRIWARYFGKGLVETENDFGLQGTLPTHPELLDWLASEFMDSGWSLKHVHRLIVNSATWRQSSHHRPDLQTIDPLNRLLARQVRLRVDAEVVRDLGLAVSGLLNSRIGGRSVYPPQPEGVYAFTQRNAAWPVSQGPDRYRRGLYTFFMRSAPYPMLTTFDTPRFDTTCTVRIRSNTPLQSLAMANDQTLLEMARALARRLQQAAVAAPAEPSAETGHSADSQRLQYAYRLCFARNATEPEVSRLLAFLQQLRQDFQAAPDDAARVAGSESPEPATAGQQPEQSAVPVQSAVEDACWTVLARTLLNLDEFIVRE